MYILLNSEPYATVDDFDFVSRGSLGCSLIGINVELTVGKPPMIYPIYRPWVTITRRAGQITLDIPWTGDEVVIVSLFGRWPFISAWKEGIGLRTMK